MSKVFQVPPEGREEIDVRLRALLETCQIYKVPMFAAVAVADDGSTTEYNNITYGSESHGICLSNDQIIKHILVSNGFDAVPKRDVVSLDMDKIV